MIETYETDAFGIPTQTQGGNSQPFQFTGQQRDASTGLYYLRARMYEPTIGRFLQRDLLAGSSSDPQLLDRYTYAGSNPVNATDPSGLSTNKVLPPPVLVIDADRMPIKALSIATAQFLLGYPNKLEYDANKARQTARGNSVCGGAKYAPLECDEYPFRSTYNGGSAKLSKDGRDSWTFPISPREHRIEGGVISQFYQQNHIQDHDEFYVVVKFSSPPPLPVPWPIVFPGLDPAPEPEPAPSGAPA